MVTDKYIDINSLLRMVDENGNIPFEKDKEAAKLYFKNNINRNTVFFHSLEEKLDYLFEEGLYKESVFNQYDFDFIKSLFKKAYAHKFRFQSFLGAYKFYTSYALKTPDGEKYLERYEDRVVTTALALAKGDTELATDLMEEIIANRYQPATPTFLNAGLANSGEQVSCFLLRVEDNMESIARAITSSLQLSKRGGGVALSLTNIRESGAPIKGRENMASGVIPILKLLEDSFSYANQLGARQGAGAAYLNAHHMDIMSFLDTKRENADEKIRIKTLSIGVVIPDITIQLAAKNEPMYLFSTYDVEREYGMPFSEVDITHAYYDMVDNPNIKKSKISARQLLQTIAELQFESGYPYILFEDSATRQNPNNGRITMSNLCSEILQENNASEYYEDGSYRHIGNDISCNLGSLNIAKVMQHGDIQHSVETAIRALTNVARDSNINSVPSIQKGNQDTLAVGLGQMNLHGYLASVGIDYDSPEALDFARTYFSTIRYYALLASNILAIENEEVYIGFEKSAYKSGIFFDKYIEEDWSPRTETVKRLFRGIDVPSKQDWEMLKSSIMAYGIANKYLLAIAPTGSISYVNNATASVHPITHPIEARKEGKIGRIYYPAPHMTNENKHLYKTAYDISPQALIDMYAEITRHTDQGVSCTLFFPGSASTRDVNKAQLYAFKKGLKTLYYIRIRQEAVEGTEVQDCVSCSI